jgi:hypothetical protein
MPIVRSGRDQARTTLSSLYGGEENLKTLASIQETLRSHPSKVKDVLDTAEAIEKQISVVKAFASSNDPSVRRAATNLLTSLTVQRLAVEDPFFAHYVKTILDELQSAAADAKLIDSKELLTMLTLAGDLSEGERSMFKFLAALLDVDLKDKVLDPAMDKAYLDSRSVTLDARVRLAASRMLPLLAPLYASSVVTGLVSPQAGIATLIGGMMVGRDVGSSIAQSTRRKLAMGKGLNRFGREDVQHALLRPINRAQDHSLWALEGETLKKRARDEATFTGEILRARPKSENADEQAATEALRSYATALIGASKLDDREAPKAIDEARAALLRAVSRLDLSQPDVLPPLADEQQVMASTGVLFLAQAQVVLGMTNQAMLRKVKDLEHDYGSKPIGQRQISDADLSALKKFAGSKPSLAEFIAVAQLERQGITSLAQVFGKDAAATMPDGSKLYAGELKEFFEALIDDLPGRRAGKQREDVGAKIVKFAKYFSVAVGLGVSMWSGAGLVAVLAAYVAPGMVGGMLGRYLQKTGAEERLLSGVEPEKERVFEAAAAFERIEKLSFDGTTAEVKARLQGEALQIESLISGVAYAREIFIGPQIENLRKVVREEIEELAVQMRARGTEVTREEIEEAIEARVYDASRQFEASFAQPLVVYDAVNAFVGDLRAASELGDVQAMREAIAGAKEKLFNLDVAAELWSRRIEWGTVAEDSPKLQAYLEAKQKLVLAVKEFAKTGNDETSMIRFVDESRSLVNARKKIGWFTRQFSLRGDEVDSFAKRAVKHPEHAADPRAISWIAENGDGLIKEYGDEYKERSTISDKRARQIADEVVDVLWSDVYPYFGVQAGQKQPELKDKDVQPVREGEFIVGYDVTGKFEGGGSFSVHVSSHGEPKNIELDFGAALLGRFASNTVFNHLRLVDPERSKLVAGQARLLSEPPAGVDLEALKGYGVEKVYHFEVTAGGQPYRVALTPDGFPLYDSLKGPERTT